MTEQSALAVWYYNSDTLVLVQKPWHSRHGSVAAIGLRKERALACDCRL